MGIRERHRSDTSRTSGSRHSPSTQPRYIPETLHNPSALFPRPESLSDESPPDRDDSRTAGEPASLQLPDVALKFIRSVPLNDWSGYKYYIERNPEILRDSQYQSRYLSYAEREFASASGSRKNAFNALAICSTINRINEYMKLGRGNFLDRLISARRDASDDLRDTFTHMKELCESGEWRVSTSNQGRHPNPRHDSARSIASDVSRLNLDQQQRQQTFQQDSRHSDRPPETSVSAPAGPLPTRRHVFPETDAGAEPQAGRPRYEGFREEPQQPSRHARHARTTPPQNSSPTRPRASEAPGRDRKHSAFCSWPPSGDSQASRADPRFQQLSPSQWGDYFRVGRVFAIMTYAEDTGAPSQGDDASIMSMNVGSGQGLIAQIRRMAVVKLGHGFCWTVPIITYGNKGLKKRGLRLDSIDAHTIVYMSGNPVDWMPNEPKSSKHAIEVRPHDKTQKLAPSSRLNFEKTESVEFNNKIMKIGTVHRDSIPHFTQYWQQHKP